MKELLLRVGVRVVVAGEIVAGVGVAAVVEALVGV